MHPPYNGAMQYPTPRGQEAHTMSTTCEKCDTNEATHILHGGGPDPTDWHLCDTCDAKPYSGSPRSPIVRTAYYVTENTPGYMPDTTAAKFDTFAQAQSYANELCDQLEDDGYTVERYVDYFYGSKDANDLGRCISIDQDLA